MPSAVRYLILILLLACLLPACAEIIPCGTKGVQLQQEITIIHLAPGQVTTDTYLALTGLPKDKPATLAMPLTGPPSNLMVEILDPRILSNQFIWPIGDIEQQNKALAEKPPTSNVLLAASLIGLEPFAVVIVPAVSKARAKARCTTCTSTIRQIATALATYPYIPPTNVSVHLLGDAERWAFITRHDLPSEFASEQLAVFTVTGAKEGRADIHLHSEQPIAIGPKTVYTYPLGSNSRQASPPHSARVYAYCPARYRLKVEIPSMRGMNDSISAIRTSDWQTRPTQTWQAAYTGMVSRRAVSFSLIPHHHPVFTVIALWLIDFWHAFLTVALAFLAAWGIATRWVLQPAWQRAGHQGFPLKVSLACTGLAFLAPINIVAALLLFRGPRGMVDVMGNHSDAITTDVVILYLIYAVLVGGIFLIVRACYRYYRDVFDTGRLFWQSWIAATVIYILFSTCLWALAAVAEKAALG